MVGQAGSDQVMNTDLRASPATATIGYVEYSYPLNKNYPVVKVLNKAGYYVEPTQYNTAVALTKAKINQDKSSQLYLTQILDGVYTNPDPRAYPISSYSYMIIPTGADRPADDDGQAADAGGLPLLLAVRGPDRRPAPYGYSPLPLNLVQAGFQQIAKLKQADPKVDLTNRNVTTCNNPTFVAGHLVGEPPRPDRADAGRLRQAGRRARAARTPAPTSRRPTATRPPGSTSTAGPADRPPPGRAGRDPWKPRTRHRQTLRSKASTPRRGPSRRPRVGSAAVYANATSWSLTGRRRPRVRLARGARAARAGDGPRPLRRLPQPRRRGQRGEMMSRYRSPDRGRRAGPGAGAALARSGSGGPASAYLGRAKDLGSAHDSSWTGTKVLTRTFTNADGSTFEFPSHKVTVQGRPHREPAQP